MSSADPRERDDLCGQELVPEGPSEDLAEEYDPSTWYEVEDGRHYCCREEWDGADTDRCIWHADMEGKSADELAAGFEGPARLDRAVLRRSILADTISLSGCRLRDADFGGADLRDADLWHADLRDADLQEADLGDSELIHADLGGADLQEVDLSGAALVFADLGEAELVGADLGEAELVGADLDGAALLGAALSGANLRGADLGGVALQETDLVGADLGGADLGNANLRETALGNADLRSADLGGALLWDADLGDADLQRADLLNADLQNADLGNADLRDCRLSDAMFQDANLTDATLERADCTRANLFDADLTGAKLYGAVLANVQLNRGTTFGAHYTDGDAADPDKAAWTLRQLEGLFRENALPGRARAAYLARKDRRRRQYWHRSIVPEPIRRVVASGKAWSGCVRRGARTGLKALVNGSHGSDDGNESEAEAGGDEPSAAASVGDAGGAETADEATPDGASAGIVTDLTRWERLVATGKWARAAVAGVTARYAASPWRVVGVSLVVIAGSTVAYKLFGPLVRPPGPADPVRVGGDLAGAVSVTPPAWLAEWLTSLYFSVVTFTTLGYGDLRPASGVAQAVATVESFVGALLLALLVFVLGRRATW